MKLNRLFLTIFFLFSFIAAIAIEPPEVGKVQTLGIHKFVLEYENVNDGDYLGYTFKNTEGETLKGGSADFLGAIRGVSMAELGLEEGEEFSVEMFAFNAKSGERSDTITAGPYSFNRQEVGKKGNKIDFVYEGYARAEIARMDSFINSRVPIIERYITPAYSYTCRIIKQENTGSISSFYSDFLCMVPSEKGVKSEANFTHELIHAFGGPVLKSANRKWQYSQSNSTIEEGVTDAITDRVESEARGELHTTLHAGCIDYRHQFSVSQTYKLNTASGGMYLINHRYARLSQLLQKIEIEHPGYLGHLNQAHYENINDSDAYRPYFLFFKNQTIFYTQNKIEGLTAYNWIEKYIKEPKVYEGFKIFKKPQLYTYHSGTGWLDEIYYYRTNSDGSDWEKLNRKKRKYEVTHKYNGAKGTVALYNFNKKLIKKEDIQTKPVENPPDYQGFASVKYVTASKVDSTSDISFLKPNVTIQKNGLYRQVIKFKGAQQNNFMPLGQKITGKNKIVVGLPGRRTGTVSLYHNAKYYEAYVTNGLAVFEDIDFLHKNFEGILNFEVVKGEWTKKYQRNVIGTTINTNSLYFLFS